LQEGVLSVIDVKSCICFERLSRSARNLSQFRQCSSPVTNFAHFKY